VNVKAATIVAREFKNFRLEAEAVADFPYQATAGAKMYRMVVVRPRWVRTFPAFRLPPSRKRACTGTRVKRLSDVSRIRRQRRCWGGWHVRR